MGLRFPVATQRMHLGLALLDPSPTMQQHDARIPPPSDPIPTTSLSRPHSPNLPEGQRMSDSTYRTGSLSSQFTQIGQGPPLLLLHGFPLTRRMWSSVWDTLAERFTVIAPDLRGFSDLAEEASPFSIGDLAVDLDGLLTQCGIDQPVHVAGLSMGGYVALEFWVRYPQRVRSLILCDTRATADSEAAQRVRAQSAQVLRDRGMEPVVAGMLPKLFAPSVLEQKPAWLEITRQEMLARNPKNMALAQEAMARRRDFTSRLTELTLPILCVVGGRDVITPPAEMQQLVQLLPNAALHVVSNAGHVPPLEQPGNFLSTLSDLV